MHADSCHRNVRLLGSLCLLIGVSILLAPGRIQAAPIHLVLESDEDRPAGQEVFLASFDTLGNFIAADFASIGFTAIDIAADFSIAGFTMEFQLDDLPVKVPEPSSVGLLLLGLLGLSIARLHWPRRHTSWRP
jgi:hypothetical protein